MILEFDLGNSRGKWRLLDGGEVLERGLYTVPAHLDALAQRRGRIRRVRVASVADSGANEQLARWCSEQLGLQVEFAASGGQCGAVVNAYHHPGQLGVDRWLAVVAAYHRGGDALVVDAGSALTIDVVTATGCHLGGYILPGLALTARSLVEATHGVRLANKEGVADSVAPGCSSEEAVLHGALLAATASIDSVWRQCGDGGVVLNRLLLTGGDAERLAPHLTPLLKTRAELAPELVMDGLAWVLP